MGNTPNRESVVRYADSFGWASTVPTAEAVGYFLAARYAGKVVDAL